MKIEVTRTTTMKNHSIVKRASAEFEPEILEINDARDTSDQIRDYTRALFESLNPETQTK